MKFINVELSPLQQAAWIQSKTMQMWRAPGFNHIFVSMLNPNQTDSVMYWVKDPRCPTLATDGQRMLADPEYYFGLTIFERLFASCHEIAHAMFDHCGQSYRWQKRGTITIGGVEYPFDPKLANYAQDYVINDMLVQAKIGKIKPGWLWNPKIGCHTDNWMDVYLKLLQRPPPEDPDDDDEEEEGGGGEGEGEPSDGTDGEGGPAPNKQEDPQFDTHMDPGEASDQSADDAQDKRDNLKTAWKQAVEVAHKITMESVERGNGGAEMLKFFEQFLEPVVSWTDMITGTFAKKVGAGSYDYRRPDRRLITRDIYAPGRSGHGARRIVVVSDTSFSIFRIPKLLERFFGEMYGIISDCRPMEVIVIWCDAVVQRTVVLESVEDLAEEHKHGAEGGGGTSFIPPFEWIKEQGYDDVDALVYLTDLEGDFPEKEDEPYYPVIWATINHDKEVQATVPWGEVVEIPRDGTA